MHLLGEEEKKNRAKLPVGHEGLKKIVNTECLKTCISLETELFLPHSLKVKILQN